ncbi:MFS transporter [Cryptosporangium aurantiacum]|uniref:Drug resistance transporter, EmrB/QacA subfamily n=1 Tax=Cryptosporangium aurantiacum TaxID=134849 RepID=A0A1M7TWR2_9ACTN|nr:MFS transporter [Cryptosporangium aurantiacum]SHN75178.1 drug resistance transporter, EmrB/QacA subfamily [Cryptosporangium aurantiacum]
MTSTTISTPPDVASSRRWWALVTVGLAQLMVVLDATVVNIALPATQADLGFSNGDRQWIITAYSLAFGSLLLLGGRLSDLIGRKRTFVIALVGFAAASALGGAAQSFGALVGARALQGVFGALLAPTALAVLTTTFTVARERARAFGVFGAVAAAGGAIGLLLGGVLTETLSWRWTLYINVFIAVVAVIGTVVFVDAAERTGPRPRLDVPGTVLVSGALFAVVYGFANAETDGWGSAWTWGMLAVGVLLLAGFVLWQRRAAHPLLPLGIVLDRNRGAAYLSVLVAATGMFGVFLFVTYYLQGTLEYSPIRTGLAFLPMVIGLAVAAQLSTNVLVPRFGPKVMVPIGLGLGAVAMVALTRLGVHSTYASSLLVPLTLLGVGMGTTMPAAMQSATLGIDRQFAGVASALVNTSQQVGGSIGTALLNTLAATAATNYLAAHGPVSPAVAAEAAVHSYAVAYWWGAGFFATGAVLAAFLFRRRPATEVAADTAPSLAAEPVPAIAH